MKTLDIAAIIAALERTLGNVSHCAAELGVSRDELTAEIAREPLLSKALSDVEAGILDEAETHLRAAVTAKKSWAILFVLRTQGKSRGYGGPANRLERRARRTTRLQANDEVRAEIDQLRAHHAEDPEPAFMGRLDQMSAPGEPPGVGVRAVLIETAGDIDAAAEKMGVPRCQLLAYLARRPAALALDAKPRADSKSTLRQAAQAGKPWAVKWILRNLGGARGYGAANDSDSPNGEITNLPMEECATRNSACGMTQDDETTPAATHVANVSGQSDVGNNADEPEQPAIRANTIAHNEYRSQAMFNLTNERTDRNEQPSETVELEASRMKWQTAIIRDCQSG